jgi:hypothetical protein
MQCLYKINLKNPKSKWAIIQEIFNIGTMITVILDIIHTSDNIPKLNDNLKICACEEIISYLLDA